MTSKAESSIHKHAFWLFGVLVGVAIKEALETGVAHLVYPERLAAELHHLGLPINFPDTEIGLWPEIIRLTVFLVLVVRFYFGSAYFFGAVYEAKGATSKFPVTNYAVDFVFGFIHFVAFVILALLIDIHTTPIHHFPYLVGFILIYDVFWYVASVRRSTGKIIFTWMLVNVLTALTGAVIYLVLEYKYKNILQAERCAFYLVISVSLLDIGMMMAKRPFFKPLGKIFPVEVPDEPSESPDPAEPEPH